MTSLAPWPPLLQVLASYSDADEAELRAMLARGPALFDDLARSICPAVFGCENVKKAVLLMLMGGVHKVTPEVRGSSTAKMQGPPALLLARAPAGPLPGSTWTVPGPHARITWCGHAVGVDLGLTWVMAMQTSDCTPLQTTSHYGSCGGYLAFP